MSRIVLNNLSWSLPNGSFLFRDITAVFNNELTGFVGNNGTGKSTIAKIICGLLSPSSGNVIVDGKVKYIPQDISIFNSMIVADVVAGHGKYSAFKNIIKGNGTTKDFTLLNDNWAIENNIRMALDRVGLKFISLEKAFSSLSGGEKVKCILSSLLTEHVDFVILDEPTNHLDKEGREIVNNFISDFNKGIIIISHDKNLLRNVDTIAELSTHGIKMYGGNYDFYEECKTAEHESVVNAIKNAESELKKNILIHNLSVARQERRNRSAEKNNLNQSIPKIIKNQLRGSGEKTLNKIKDIQQKKIENSKVRVDDVKNRLYLNNEIKIDITYWNNFESKTIVNAEKVNYTYDECNDLWKGGIDFVLKGGERALLSGKNGSGKSTFLKLITGEFNASAGRIYIGTNKISLINQHLSILDNNLTILENLSNAARWKFPEHELRIRLGRFLFYKEDAFKKVSALSGGERIRAGLAYMLAREDVPELILLDEPTNNLDIESIEELTCALKNYKGALITISHDSDFISNLSIDTELSLDKYTW